MPMAYTRLLQSPLEAKDSGTSWHLEGLDNEHRKTITGSERRRSPGMGLPR